MKHSQSILLLIGIIILATTAACNLPAAEINPTNAAPTTENAASIATSTLVSLPSPTPTIYGIVSGQICFPSNPSPEMIVYVENINTHIVYEIDIPPNQATYQAELPPGGYIAFAWLLDFSKGGSFSNATICGNKATCTDHTLASFFITSGQESKDINICDWPDTIDSIPTPSNKG